jgi:GNAT superfamily N-acetyltransferase
LIRHDFILANIADHRDELLELNVEYMTWVFERVEALYGARANRVVGRPASEYVSSVIDKACGDPPPTGAFYLATVDDRLAGMGGFRRLRPGVAEVKRIYFRPEFRGRKLGDRMLERLLTDAQAFGYRRLCLDTGPFMQSAHRLYERHGFSDCAAYEGAEVPPELHSGWRFMERWL